MFLSFRTDVQAALSDALASLDLPTDDLGIEEPPEDVDAVLASSVSFRLASEVGAPPPKIAQDIADAIDTDPYEYLDSVQTLGPYVNFLPTQAYYAGTIDAAQSDDYGRLAPTGDTVVVEHTSANPSGPIHVGRARNPIIGDSLRRILDFAGNDVETHYYVNDAGRQMAVFTWAYETFDEDELDEQPARDSPEYDLVRYYRKGNAFLEDAAPDEVEEAEAEIATILQGIEEGDEDTYERVQYVVDTVLGGMQNTLNRLPAEFDRFVKETEFMRDGSCDDVVSRLKESEYAVFEDDAWQLELDDFGIEKNLVFLRSDGTSLYTTRDLAHHEWKFQNFDRAVTLLGEDHKLQADQLACALEILGNDTSQLQSIHYSWVNLPEGGMSTRKGTGIDLDDLLDEAISRARDEVEARIDTRLRDNELTEEDIQRIAEQVGIGAVRYDIVSKQPTKGITFEWEQALDFEAQSAPYVQYVHARTCGILDEADVPTAIDASVLTAEAERALLRQIARFPAVIEEAADELRPHIVATYTREFAEAFNRFYRECPVLKEEDESVRTARLALVAASRTTIANALSVLGIAAPTSM
ncbi:arginine--tRNA ligase [Haladaptatus sp. CMSO5]|uniref:arginine--tRNA ligase n=1 Tax=Haladaptatus sp. CMSO5 TaxID=3120514 RepID=UPI002FCDE53A